MSWFRTKSSDAMRSASMAPQRTPANEHDMPQIFRTFSATTTPRPRYNNNGEQYEDDKLFRTASNTYDFNAVTTIPTTEGNGDVMEATEETLVTIWGAMVHLVDEEGSPLLAQGAFSVVRIEQEGNGIVAFVRVGDNLRWPLTQDESAVKIDSTHYCFSIRVPRPVDQMAKETVGDPGNELLSYGVTFSVSGQERQLEELDLLLEQYSGFSNPQLVRGDRLEVVPESVVSTEGHQATEGNQAEFWRTMAPNVDDYNSKLAKSMAKGTGGLIKSIFKVRDSTVSSLENGSLYVKGKVKPTSKPSTISPKTLHNLQRVQSMSVATEKVAKNLLEGVVKTAGFFSGAMMKSTAGKKFFKLLPGEVALVSMDAFANLDACCRSDKLTPHPIVESAAKVLDALEQAGTDVMHSTKMYTQDVVTHRYGEGAGQVTETTMSTAGHVFATAWTVTKVRRALNPAKYRPTKTGMLKAAAKAGAKAAVGGGSK